MMTSVIGAPIKSRPRNQTGFTLLEVLVVVLIIGITLSLAVINLGDRQEDLIEEEGRRLSALIKLASEEAIMNGEELGLMLGEKSYLFSRLEGEEWQPLAEDRQFRQRQFPHGMTLGLELEERPVILDEDQEQPHIFILSSGELTPFLLTLRSADEVWKYELTGHFNGQLRGNGPTYIP